MFTVKREVYQAPEIVETKIERLEDWAGIHFESSSGLTEEFAAFAKMFKQRIKRECEKNELSLCSFDRGHFYCSGFVGSQKTGRYIYFSISDVRYFSNSWLNNILIRTAEHIKDFTGGRNNSTDLKNFGQTAKALLDNESFWVIT